MNLHIAKRVKPSQPYGFTLIELLAVIAIVTIIAGFLIPSLKSAQDQALKTDDLARLRQLGVARAIYSTDYDADVFRCAPLVTQGLVPAQLCLSKSDLTSHGLSNEVLLTLSNEISMYGQEVTGYRQSFLASGDMFPRGGLLSHVNREPDAGWLVNVVRVKEDENVQPYPWVGHGQYQRLRLDGSVVNKTVAHYQAAWKHGILNGSSPVTLFCDPDATWMNTITTPPHS